MRKCENCKHAFKFKGVGYCAKTSKPRKDMYIYCANYEEKPQTITIEIKLDKEIKHEKTQCR